MSKVNGRWLPGQAEGLAAVSYTHLGVKVKKNSHAAQKNGYEIIEGEYSPGQKLIKPIAVWVYLLLAFLSLIHI